MGVYIVRILGAAENHGMREVLTYAVTADSEDQVRGLAEAAGAVLVDIHEFSAWVAAPADG